MRENMPVKLAIEDLLRGIWVALWRGRDRGERRETKTKARERERERRRGKPLSPEPWRKKEREKRDRVRPLYERQWGPADMVFNVSQQRLTSLGGTAPGDSLKTLPATKREALADTLLNQAYS